MRLLNLCCGATRPGEPWTNLDSLHSVLLEGTPEKANLDRELNYVNHDVLSGPLPFPDDTFDGILASHCVEHWDCQEAVRVLKECHRVLYPSGFLMISVPNASYFREVFGQDCHENAVELFGEPIFLEDGEDTFFGYGLFNRFHKQILTDDALWALLQRSGFGEPDQIPKGMPEHTVVGRMISLLNRRKFSLEVLAIK